MAIVETAHNKIDIFELEIPLLLPGPHDAKIEFSGVTVVFENGHFEQCKYNFQGLYTFEQWQVLGQIAEFIKAKQIEFNEA